MIAEGLTCLIKVGAEADQNYQNYILRGLLHHNHFASTKARIREVMLKDFNAFKKIKSENNEKPKA